MINAVTFFIALLASDVGARPGQVLFERAQASYSQGRFDEARADWKAKQADDAVPGATGEPDADDGELPPPDPHETD